MSFPLQQGLSLFEATRAHLKPGESAALFGRFDEVILAARLDSAEGQISLRGEITLKADAFYTQEGLRVFATACWIDHGQLRSASGLVLGARVQEAELFTHGGAPAPAQPKEPKPAPKGGKGETPRAPKATKTPKAKGEAEPIKRQPPEPPPEEEAPTVDLSPELAELKPAPQPKQSPLGWGAAVAASKRIGPSAPAPKRAGIPYTGALLIGDLLVHPRFGRCRVVQEPQGGKVRLRKSAGGFLDLHLKVCKLIQEEDEDGRRVFRVQMKGR